MSGLVRVGQDDFGAGMLRGVAPDVQPGIGVHNAENGLFNDDGDVYRRGGTAYFSTAATAPLTFVWTGYLNNTPRILFADATKFYTLAAFVPPQAPVVLGGAGLPAPVLPAIVNNTVYLPTGEKWAGGAGVAAWTIPPSLPAGTKHVCTAAGRLLVAAGNRVAFSVANSPEVFVADDYHDLPGGVLVIGMTAIRDTAFIFTNYGLYTISNLAFDLTDALGNIQQQLQLITPEISLWHESALTGWQGRIVAPCMDKIYVVDGLSAPVPVSDSITDVYLSEVKAGHRPGGAKVFRNHYFLPVIDSVNTPQIQFVGRLDRPVRGRSTYYPWSTLTGHVSQMVMADFALVAGRPRMLGAMRDNRIADMTGVLEPSLTNAIDADGTEFVFDVESRDFPTGQGQPNHVRRLRLRYTVDADGPVALLAGVSTGSQAQRYEDLLPRTYAQVFADYPDYEAMFRGGLTSEMPPSSGDPARFWYSLGDKLLPEPGTEPITWTLTGAKRTRYVRARFRCTAPVGKLIVHHLDLSVRQSAHDR